MFYDSLNEHFFDERDELFQSLSERIACRLNDSVVERGQAVLAVSGGGTPGPLFKRLASMRLPWEKIWVTLVDERWVPQNHEDSNERLLRETLLVDQAAKARFLGLKTEEITPDAGEATCRGRLEQLPLPMDVVLLGMGNDGHTASLFPGGDQLQRALEASREEWCIAMRAPGAKQPRMTLNANVLLACHDLILLCTGQAKLDTLQTARAAGAVEDMPIRFFLRQKQTSLHCFWAP